MSRRERQRPTAGNTLTPHPEPLMPASQVDRRDTPPLGDPPVYLSARVPKSLRTELQHEAVRQGRPIANLIQDAVRAYLDVHKST
jgi:hypothetical protein